MRRRIWILGASAAAVTCLTFAGAAQAEPTTYSGTVPNGGCDGVHTVSVSGPSRIEVQVSSTDAANLVFGYILAPNGSVVAQDSYDTPGAGNYGVRVCAWYDHISPPTLRFTARYATAPAGQAALPRTQGQGAVLGTTTTLSRDVHGTGAIRTRAGLAWFSVKQNQGGAATVRVLNPRLHRHYLFTGATVSFGTSFVRITTPTMTLTINQGGAERITFRSLHFKASGKVVRGSFIIV